MLVYCSRQSRLSLYICSLTCPVLLSIRSRSSWLGHVLWFVSFQTTLPDEKASNCLRSLASCLPWTVATVELHKLLCSSSYGFRKPFVRFFCFSLKELGGRLDWPWNQQAVKSTSGTLGKVQVLLRGFQHKNRHGVVLSKTQNVYCIIVDILPCGFRPRGR